MFIWKEGKKKKTKEVVSYLTFSKQTLVLTCLQYKSFENTVGKGEIAHKEQFLLFPLCFLPFWRTFRHFHQIQNSRLQTPSKLKGLADDNFKFD